MKRIIFKMVMAFLVFAFISGYASVGVEAQTKDEAETLGRIVYINQAKGFVVFNLGAEDGVKKGSIFEVYREDIKVAQIKAVKVRNKFSAADIGRTYKNMKIMVGDTLKTSKQITDAIKRRQEQLLLEEQNRLLAQAKEYLEAGDYERSEEIIFQVLELNPQNKKALEMLSTIEQKIVLNEQNRLLAQAKGYLKEMDYEQAEAITRQALELDPHNKKVQKMLSKVQEAVLKVMSMEPKIIRLDINAPKRDILPVAIDVFKKYGCLITSSDPAKYNLEAYKNVKLPFKMGLITDGGPFIRNKIYYSVELQESPNLNPLIINRLIIYLRGVYDSEGKVSSYQIKMSSPIYRETKEMVLRIKYLAENL